LQGASLSRRLETVRGSCGQIVVKIIDGVNDKQIVPDPEECRWIAESCGLPLREVQEKLLAELNGSLPWLRACSSALSKAFLMDSFS